jgi:hypothetical protein
MILSLDKALMGVAGLISAPPANGKRAAQLQQFHEDEPSLKPMSRFRSPSRA